jgi:hypothetical protein
LHNLNSTLRQAVPDHPPEEPNAYLLGGQPLGLWGIQDGIPVIIQTEYIAKGELLKDTTLYDFEFFQLLRPRGKPDPFYDLPQFTNLRYIRRLSQHTEPRPLLDSLMRAKKFAFK